MDDHTDYIHKTELKIKSIVDQIGWNLDELIQSKDSPPLIKCPINKNHRLSASNLEDHIKHCSWRSEGYLPDEQPFSEPSHSMPSILITENLQETIIAEAASKNPDFVKSSSSTRPVPKTSNKLLQWLSRDERLAIYDYVVANTETTTVFQDYEFKQPEKIEESKELTELEIAAAQRDAKRRRATYRNKVHTNRKTHTEILREVIESQLTTLVEESSTTQHSDDSRLKDEHRSCEDDRHDNQQRTYYSDKDSLLDSYVRKKERDSSEEKKRKSHKMKKKKEKDRSERRHKKEHKHKKKKKKSRRHDSDNSGS